MDYVCTTAPARGKGERDGDSHPSDLSCGLTFILGEISKTVVLSRVGLGREECEAIQMKNSFFSEYKKMMIGKDNYSRLCFPPFIGFIHNPVRGLLSPSPISFLSFFIDRAIHATRFQAPNALISVINWELLAKGIGKQK